MAHARFTVDDWFGLARSAVLAVLAVGLSASPVFAQRLAASASGSTSLVISAEAVLSVTAPASLVPFATAVAPERASIARRGTPWWPTALAVAGPLADGLSTMHAMRQSGPHAKVMEGNGFYHKLFGDAVKAGEIMAFKVGQAALFGAIIHYAGRAPENRAKAIGVAVVTAGINFFVASRNMKSASLARQLNGGGR